MNLRCTYCQTPFTVGRLEKLAAIQRMQAEDLHHFDVFCPRCRRAISVSRQRLEISTPGWQDGLKTLEAEAAKIEKGRMEPVSAPVEEKPASVTVEKTRSRHTSKATVESKAPVETKPVPKTAAKPAAKSAEKKPVAKAKPVAQKSVTKSKPAKKVVKKK